MENSQWKWVYISLILAVLFVILIFVGSGMDGMSGGYAVSFISFFLTLCSFAVALLFFTRARAMDDILGGKNLLAHWVYPEDETRKSAEREYVGYMENNRALLYVVGGFLVIGMVLMIIFGGEAGVATAGMLFVVLIIVAIVSVVAPKLERKRALKAPRDAYITDNGIIYEGGVYPFHSFLMRMDGVSYEKETAKHPPILVFSFIQLVGLYILRPFEISIPVPPGEEEKARRIANRMSGVVEEEETPGSPVSLCTACGAVVKPADQYCESCGAKATSDPKTGSPGTCPVCGNNLKPGKKFCGSCGYKQQ
ncbi:MAG: zinc ribbon domain-containing protein [Methanomicrobiales archaeon]